MKGLKKIVSLALAVLMLFTTLSLTSCNRKYDEEEVITAAKELLQRAEMLNTVYYGSGIKYLETDDGIGSYEKADTTHLSELGFSTIDELCEITENTFSVKYCNILYTTILSPLRNDGTLVSPARYYQVSDEETGEPTHIMVYSDFTPMLTSRITIDYSTLRVEGSEKEKVIVLVSAILTNETGECQSTELKIFLVEEENGWRIDSPFYENYNALKDKYDDLKDKELKK